MNYYETEENKVPTIETKKTVKKPTIEETTKIVDINDCYIFTEQRPLFTTAGPHCELPLERAQEKIKNFISTKQSKNCEGIFLQMRVAKDKVLVFNTDGEFITIANKNAMTYQPNKSSESYDSDIIFERKYIQQKNEQLKDKRTF